MRQNNENIIQVSESMFPCGYVSKIFRHEKDTSLYHTFKNDVSK